MQSRKMDFRLITSMGQRKSPKSQYGTFSWPRTLTSPELNNKGLEGYVKESFDGDKRILRFTRGGTTKPKAGATL